MRYDDWLRKAVAQIANKSDAIALLSHITQTTRKEQLLYNHELKPLELDWLANALNAYQAGMPLAYLLGKEVFFGREFIVSQDTLAPRVDTEAMVAQALSLLVPHETPRVLELGTGTGIIGITIACERPDALVIAVDNSHEALAIAKKNMIKHQVDNLHLFISNWFDCLNEKTLCALNASKQKAGFSSSIDACFHQAFDLIISNPPYLAVDDPYLPALKYEPQQALVAAESGLAAIKHILQHGKTYLRPMGYCLIEHGYQQNEDVLALAEQFAWQNAQSHRDYQGNWRFIVCQSPAI